MNREANDAQSPRDHTVDDHEHCRGGGEHTHSHEDGHDHVDKHADDAHAHPHPVASEERIRSRRWDAEHVVFRSRRDKRVRDAVSRANHAFGLYRDAGLAIVIRLDVPPGGRRFMSSRTLVARSGTSLGALIRWI